MISLGCIHVIAPRPSPHVLGHALNPGTWHLWKWKCALEAGSGASYYGQTSAVSGGPAVTVSTDRCREDGPTTAVPGSAVRTAGCCSNKCPHLDHPTNQIFGHFDPFYPFPYSSEYRSSTQEAGRTFAICLLEFLTPVCKTFDLELGSLPICCQVETSSKSSAQWCLHMEKCK